MMFLVFGLRVRVIFNTNSSLFKPWLKLVCSNFMFIQKCPPPHDTTKTLFNWTVLNLTNLN